MRLTLKEKERLKDGRLFQISLLKVGYRNGNLINHLIERGAMISKDDEDGLAEKNLFLQENLDPDKNCELLQQLQTPSVAFITFEKIKYANSAR